MNAKSNDGSEVKPGKEDLLKAIADWNYEIETNPKEARKAAKRRYYHAIGALWK